MKKGSVRIARQGGRNKGKSQRHLAKRMREEDGKLITSDYMLAQDADMFGIGMGMKGGVLQIDDHDADLDFDDDFDNDDIE